MANYWQAPTAAVSQAVDWVGVTIFFVVACLWSFVFAHVSIVALPSRVSGLAIDDSILVGFGPAAGTLVAMLSRPPVSTERSFFGPKIGWSVLALAIPAISCVLLTFLPDANHKVLWPFALSVTLYCVGEELGWRGWLFDALSPLARWQSAVITAALWFGWHWTFLADQLSHPGFGIGFAGGIVIASFGLMAAVTRTRATALAVAWHSASKLLLAPAQIALMLGVIIFVNVFGRVRRAAPSTQL